MIAADAEMALNRVNVAALKFQKQFDPTVG
jgi:hypothetical protein